MYRAIAVVNTKKLDGSNSRLSWFQQLTRLVTAGDQPLQGETEDRVNLLILGIGGPGHDGPYLTDTMMVASYQPSTNQLALLSIPRDLVVDIPGYDYRKINNVLSFGRDQDYPGGGEALTVKVVSDLLDIPIHYYGRIDFPGFAEVIDRLGGVNVNVPMAFTDYQYPDNNYGYQTIKFTAGPQQMDGGLALKYARSRHGGNGEGSDFARARRQQQIIFATKEKLLSFGTVTNPKKLSDILGSIGSHSQTNMEVWEMVRLAKLAGQVRSDEVVNKVLDSGQDGLLQNEIGVGGAAILVPRGRSYDDIQFLAQNIFLAGQAAREAATVLVVNATQLTGLAERFSQSLASFGLTTARPAALKNVTVGETVMIDLGSGRAPRTLNLAGSYARARGTISLEQWEVQLGDTSLRELIATATPKANGLTNRANTNAATAPSVVLILGQDQPKTNAAMVIPYFQPKALPPVTAKPATISRT